MLRLAIRSRQSPAEALRLADEFFGAGGLGLAVTARSPGELRMVGGGGYVHITVTGRPGDEPCDVEIVTSEWERQVLEFARRAAE